MRYKRNLLNGGNMVAKVYRTNSVNKVSMDDRIFYLIVNTILTLIMLVVLYPCIYVLSASFSSATAVTSGKVILWPVEFSLEGYRAVFKENSILLGYRNSIFYTVFGTCINLFITCLAAYPLSRKTLPGRNTLSFIFSFTMLFSGGMIPSYILILKLGLMNTVWALLLPGALSVYNMIIVRTYFQSNIPESLRESAQIDGCGDTRYLISVILPLSKPVMAVISLYYAVGHWNSYFSAMIYLNDYKLYPLQIVLREILILNTVSADMIIDDELMQAKHDLSDLLKYSLIIVASIPMLILYPFIQKYFIKGVMIGSLKG